MTTVYLNGEYLPMEAARISPMDRGFLFGDGIYEVIPCYGGQSVGLTPHLARLRDGLGAIEIEFAVHETQWRDIVKTLAQSEDSPNLGIYIHVSRGADTRRGHAMPKGITPTCFAFPFAINSPPVADKARATRFTVAAMQDLRWQRCHIKSTSLLGNVLHYQEGQKQGCQEILLFNDRQELTEAAACNVFIVKDGTIATPLLDHQKLPGITRYMLLDMLHRYSERRVEERIITRAEIDTADEIWLTSSSKEVAPVVAVDGRPVGDGDVGDIWLEAQSLFSKHRFDY